MPTKPNKYHPLIVLIHWISTFLIISMLAFGTLGLMRIPNEAGKLVPLTLHAGVGILILILTILRIILRFTLPKPERATAGSKFLDIVAQITHGLLYLGALGMGVSGLFIAIQSGLFQMVLSGSWTLTGGFFQYTPRLFHRYFALGMDAIILLHIGAAFFHQFIRKDRLLARMSLRGGKG
jgi:cytochrome b561